MNTQDHPPPARCQQQIAAWENRTRKPKMQSLMKIADVLGVDWTTLIE